MKKSIILALAFALPAMAGVETSAPATVVDTPVAAPACSAFGVEVGAVYTAALNDIDAGIDGINTWGVEVTGVYDFTPNWAATVRVGWATGSDDYSEVEIEVENWTITAGLRYSAPITDKLCWYAGGEIGLAHSTYEFNVPNMSKDFDDWGVAYGIEAGLRYNITPCMYVYGAVHYSGNFAEPKFFSDVEASAQAGYGVRMGIGGKF